MRILLIFAFLSLSVPASAEDEWQQIHRIVAIGDLHGDYERYIELLKLNGLVDKRLKWQGGKTHLVQLGDVPDRGPDSLKIIRHLMKLTKQAKKKGGLVHSLIGNHEAMNVAGDLRYVHPGEYSALIDRRSAKRQKKWLVRVFEHRLLQFPEFAEQQDEIMLALGKEYPLGYVEHRGLWHPGQELAKWVASHNTVIKINRTLYLHGGLNPHGERISLTEINKRIQKEIEQGVLFETGLAMNPSGPLWYRGLAQHEAELELLPLELMLEFYDADRIVVAHTPTGGQIIPRFDGRVIMADVGISAAYGGHVANLLVEGGKLMSVTRAGVAPLLTE